MAWSDAAREAAAAARRVHAAGRSAPLSYVRATAIKAPGGGGYFARVVKYTGGKSHTGYLGKTKHASRWLAGKEARNVSAAYGNSSMFTRQRLR